MQPVKPYLNIKSGSHSTAQEGMCVMEAVAYFVGEKHSDKPSCTCSVIGRAMISFNDRFKFRDNAERTETLLPLIPVVVGTTGTLEDQIQRGYIAADFAVRVFLKLRMEAVGRHSDAQSLQALPSIVNKETAIIARDFVRKTWPYAAAYAAAADAAYAAAAYADAAAYAYAAAAYAAYAAAAYAAYAAAAYAAYAAADAAAAAAADAAYAAAKTKYQSIREAIKIAFSEMIKKMAAVGSKKMELSVQAKIEFEAACQVVSSCK